MIKTRIFTIALLLISIISNAQDGRIGDILDPNRNNRGLWESGSAEDIKGSPYFFDDWYVGEIKTKLGSVYPNVKIKYAPYTDQLFFLTEDGDERAIAREKVHYFQFNDELGKSYLFEHIPYQGYLLRITKSENITLYKKIEKTIKEAPENNGYNASSGKAEFIESRVYYIQTNSIVEPIPSKNDYVELFPDKKSEIMNFIKKNKVKFKKDEKMIDLVKFTQSLI
ncbi:hypothetical protein [Ekhidna sp.]